MNKNQLYTPNKGDTGYKKNTPSTFPEIKDCPEALRTAYSICLNCGFPSAIFWGEELSIYYNHEYAVILGDKHPAAFGTPAAQVYPEIWDTLSLQLNAITTNLKTLKLIDTLILLERHGYQEECYFDYTLSPLFDNRGNAVGIFNIAIETTKQKLNQRRSELINLFISQQHFAQPLTSCIDGCGLILKDALEDIPFHLLYMKTNNEKYKLVSFSGISEPNHELNWPIEELIVSGSFKYIDNLANFFIEPVVNFHTEPCLEAAIVPLKHEHSSLSGFLVAGISPRKRFDQHYLEFIQTVSWHIGACFSTATSFDQFVELEEEKDNLLGVISHELRTPITSIKAYSQLALRNLNKGGDIGSEGLLKRMDVQIAKLNLIVSDMLDGTNFRAGRISYRKENFDFDEMVATTVTVFEENNKQTFLLDLNSLQNFVGDRQRLKQVVSNLISNALKYTKENSEIRIKTAIVDKELHFSIEDHGIGIKQEEKTKIFERFYRSVNIKQYTYPGIGLGLFIAKEIIKHFGGKIWVISNPGHGATFHFNIPIIR
ncbi:signal transduction histidine kinase [Pedobacter sp. CAN_A7]|uniref:sensor histidine kinase n=1 Tax=Pedobacter sp. CAN_A7 TaxID=2787722 RepID=UPI0018C97931